MGFYRRYCTRRRYSIVLEKTAPTVPFAPVVARKVNASLESQPTRASQTDVRPLSMCEVSQTGPLVRLFMQKINYEPDIMLWPMLKMLFAHDFSFCIIL
jgi:hypothetical protein